MSENESNIDDMYCLTYANLEQPKKPKNKIKDIVIQFIIALDDFFSGRTYVCDVYKEKVNYNYF